MILQNKLNNILNAIAPLKRVQFKKDNLKFVTAEHRDNIKESQILLEKTIQINTPEAWREYTNYKNKITKIIKNYKLTYIKSRFENCTDRWRALKQINGNKKAAPPSKIIHNGKIITSPIQIANIANVFFKEKIAKIR